MNKNVVISVIIGLSTLIIGCTNKPAFDGQAWSSYASPAAAGFDEKKLAKLTEYLDKVDETESMVVVHKGKIAYQYGDPSELSYLASVRKSILAILFGKHVESGTIDLSTTIAELGIDDNLGLLPIEKQATIDHLITARSGIYHPAANGGYDMSFAEMRGDFQPGENFVYNNWDFNVAGHVFERYAQQSIYQEIEEQLAIPLGFQDWHIDNQKKYHKDSQSKYPAYHIYLSTRDLAKIGQLMLQKGQWGDQQVISKSWVEKITTPVTTHAEVSSRGKKSFGYQPDYSYSYMWWTFENMHGDLKTPGAYSATGWGGHFLTVIPSMDLVIAHKGDLNFLEMWGLLDGGVSDETYYYMLHLLTSANF